jgi:hypothetical protein
MTCGFLDIACHADSLLAPAWAFLAAWWWVGFGAACMLGGAWMGPRATLAVLTVGIGLLIYDRHRK